MPAIARPMDMLQLTALEPPNQGPGKQVAMDSLFILTDVMIRLGAVPWFSGFTALLMITVAAEKLISIPYATNIILTTV